MPRPEDTHLLLSLPSSGSDWFARQVAATMVPEWQYYDKEYLNPLTNWDLCDQLGYGFGCEAASFSHNVVMPSAERMAMTLERTWEEQDQWNFDKEVWSPLSLPFFVERGYRVAVLLRTTRDTFPPTRARVWSWYDAIASQGYVGKDAGFAEWCRRVHNKMLYKLWEDAARFDVPFVFYERLTQDVHADAIAVELDVARFDRWMPRTRELAERLVASRKISEKTQRARCS